MKDIKEYEELVEQCLVLWRHNPSQDLTNIYLREGVLRLMCRLVMEGVETDVLFLKMQILEERFEYKG